MAAAVAVDDYYAILEVSQFATFECIRESYKRLALKYHPDKNKDDGATSHFQSLATAWETLKDGKRRLDYDRNYVKVSKRKRDDVAANEAGGIGTWRSYGSYENSHKRAQSDMSGDWTSLRKRVQAWHSMAHDDYLARLRTWKSFRENKAPRVVELQEALFRQEIDLGNLMGEDYDSVIQRFQEAISRSPNQAQEDRASILGKLMEARRNHVARLDELVTRSRNRLAELITEVEIDRRRYEEEEAKVRAHRIRRALEFLDPRGIEAPLFSPIDRRGRAINLWKALSRVKPATRFVASLHADEGPWHSAGQWERVAGEQTCGRCDAIVHDLVGECGPAKCPGCGMITCFGCHRTLLLLQEYERWITSPAASMGESLLSVLFDSADPDDFRQSTSGGGSAFHRSRRSEDVCGYHL